MRKDLIKTLREALGKTNEDNFTFVSADDGYSIKVHTKEEAMALLKLLHHMAELLDALEDAQRENLALSDDNMRYDAEIASLQRRAEAGENM